MAVLNPTDADQSVKLNFAGANLAGKGTRWRLASTEANGQNPNISDSPVDAIPRSVTLPRFSINIYELPQSNQAIGSDMNKFPALLSSALLCVLLPASGAQAAEKCLASPDGALEIVVSDDHGLQYCVEFGGKMILTNSLLGLEFKDGVKLGPAAVITKAATRTT